VYVDRLPVPGHGLGQGSRIKSTEDLNDLGERLAVLGQDLTVLGQDLTVLGQDLTVLGQDLTVLLLYLLDRVNSVFDVEHGVTQGADGVVLLGELACKARDSQTSHEGQSIEAGTSPRYRLRFTGSGCNGSTSVATSHGAAQSAPAAPAPGSVSASPESVTAAGARTGRPTPELSPCRRPDDFTPGYSHKSVDDARRMAGELAR